MVVRISSYFVFFLEEEQEISVVIWISSSVFFFFVSFLEEEQGISVVMRLSSCFVFFFFFLEKEQIPTVTRLASFIVFTSSWLKVRAATSGSQ